jgi:hypothetical protein
MISNNLCDGCALASLSAILEALLETVRVNLLLHWNRGIRLFEAQGHGAISFISNSLMIVSSTLETEEYSWLIVSFLGLILANGCLIATLTRHARFELNFFKIPFLKFDSA